jgi:toxin YoeB
VNILFHKKALEDYTYFKENDKKIFDKINLVIKDIAKSPFTGIGKPEPLRYSLSGFWSRRINREHRLVYTLKDNEIYILQCRYHY